MKLFHRWTGCRCFIIIWYEYYIFHKDLVEVFHRRTRKRDTNICLQVTRSQTSGQRNEDTYGLVLDLPFCPDVETSLHIFYLLKIRQYLQTSFVPGVVGQNWRQQKSFVRRTASGGCRLPPLSFSQAWLGGSMGERSYLTQEVVFDWKRNGWWEGKLSLNHFMK